MKTKQFIFAILTVTLVIAFIISCSALHDNFSSEAKETAPPGKGLVRLAIVDLNGRTVMPDTTGYTALGDFDHFTLNVKVTSNSAPVTNPTALLGDFTYTTSIFSANPFTLDSGVEYTFTLIAYKDATSASAAALGTVNVTVNASNNTATIVLKEIMDGAGTGTLAVTPVIGDGSTATVTLASLSPGGTTGITNAAVPYNNAAIKSGWYRMTINLTKTKCESISVIDIVYIWQNFTTTYAAATPALRSNVHTLTFDYGTDITAGNNGDGTGEEDVSHGGEFTTTIGNTHSLTGDILAGWFTAANGGGDEIFNSSATTPTKILKPYALYAKWEPATVSVTINNPTLSWNGPTNPVLSASAASFNQTDGTINITISITNAGAFATFQWYIDGTPAGTGSTLAITGNSTTAVNWYQQGAHTITLEATVAGGQQYSGSTTITCAP